MPVVGPSVYGVVVLRVFHLLAHQVFRTLGVFGLDLRGLGFGRLCVGFDGGRVLGRRLRTGSSTGIIGA